MKLLCAVSPKPGDIHTAALDGFVSYSPAVRRPQPKPDRRARAPTPTLRVVVKGDRAAREELAVEERQKPPASSFWPSSNSPSMPLQLLVEILHRCGAASRPPSSSDHPLDQIEKRGKPRAG